MRPVLAAFVLVALVAPVRADGVYLTEQFGGTDVHDELGAHFGSAHAMRIAAGWREGPWAFEAFLSAHIDDGSGSPVRPRPGTPYVDDYRALTTYGLDVKYLQPLATHFEGYVRGRISRGLADGVGLDGRAGRGLGFGAGLQLEGRVRALGFLAWPFFFLKVGPKVTGALFLDAGHDFYRLHAAGRAGPAIDAKLTTITLGFAIGSDF